MSRMPGAEWRPLPEAGAPDGYVKSQLIFHSIVGSAEGAYGYFLNHTTLESTFIVKLGGGIIQCMDSTDRADANGDANRSAISVETEDNRNPDAFPWTEKQMDALVDIGVWACNTHPIPPRRIPSPREGGIGYHVMFGAPGPWTGVRGKTCPGIVRVSQFNRIVLPRIIAAVTGQQTEEKPMTISEALRFAQAEGQPVYLLNIEDGTREGIETHEARLGIAKLFNISPEVTKVHADVIAQFREKAA